MSTALESRGNTSQGGFQRWVKLSTDDLPLIRPPKHHMLAHITGGLTKLYEYIKENKKEEPEDSEKEKEASTETKDSSSGEKNGPTDNGLCNNERLEASNSENSDSSQKETENKDKENENDGQNEKKDDEGGGEDKSNDDKTDNDKDEKTGDKDSEKKEDERTEKEVENSEKKENKNGEKKVSAEENMEEEEEEEETTPYTDEEGEFSPEKGMPYLAGRYKYTNVLARGQSAIIIKVLDTFNNDKPLAIKVLHRVYKPIGSQEADILLELHRADPWLHVPFARLLNQFLYGPHYCLVFEYLSPTPLYNHYDQRDIRESSSLPHVRDLTVKLLTVLGFLYKQNVIHADLKPENILLCKEDDLSSIMVVDFGNALRNTDEELSLYYSDFELQTLLYRAPEVMFGMKFSLEVDMWSLGCLLAECYLGEPLFMGKSKKEILSKITALMGPFPKEFSEGEYSKEFADFVGRPMSRYQRLENLRKRLNDCKDSTFLMLVERLLTYIPDRRFTPFEAACHPFVACSTPFLYLTPSPGYIKYPTILLDMSTYPYLPDAQDEEDETSDSALSRKRLATFSRVKRTEEGSKEKENNSVNTSNASAPSKKDNVETPKNVSVPKTTANMTTGPDGKTATRSDVKETLKSMGLRCEDFTISVYSREQAHAILRRQGVEVTPNNLPSREKVASVATKGAYRNARMPDMGRGRHNMRGVPTLNPWPSKPRGRPPLTHHHYQNIRRPPPPKYQADDDDDDCVILDPPDMPKPPRAALPQQFQLMGTTVQVNRGAKRPHRPMMHQPPAKRHNSRPMQYYHKEQHEEYGAEASVQDTLKRLKNYNISITCRRNASGLGPHGRMDSDSDMGEDGHMESDEEEDMTKYLECQIGEVEDIPEQEIYDDEEIDCDDKEDVDYNPRGGKKKNKKSPRKGRRPQIPSVMLEQHMSESGVETVLDSSTDNPLDSSVEIEEGKELEDDEQNAEGMDSSSPKEQDGEEQEVENTEENQKDLDQEGDKESMDEEEEKPVDEEEEEKEEEEKNEEEEEEAEKEQGEEAQHPEETENQESNEEPTAEEEENLIEKETEVEGNDCDEEETKEEDSAVVNENDANKTENPKDQEGHEDEEIDDELEEQLLAGDVGDEEMEEEL